MSLLRTWIVTVASWMLTHWGTPVRVRAQAWDILRTVHPEADEIDAALLAAFADCGLPREAYDHDFDLLHSGKLHEVLVHASARLGNPLVTVADVRELLV